jgi:hypothetical protein
MNDSERFDMAVRQIVGKRLTRDVLTGKELENPPTVNWEEIHATKAREEKSRLTFGG